MRDALDAPGDGVPHAGGAVPGGEAGVEEGRHGRELARLPGRGCGRRRVRPTRPRASPWPTSAGRRGPRRRSAASATRPSASSVRSDAEQRHSCRRRALGRRRRPPALSTRSNGATSSRRTSGGSTSAAQCPGRRRPGRRPRLRFVVERGGAGCSGPRTSSRTSRSIVAASPMVPFSSWATRTAGAAAPRPRLPPRGAPAGRRRPARGPSVTGRRARAAASRSSPAPVGGGRAPTATRRPRPAGQKDVGDAPPGGEADEVETEGRGADQGVRHGEGLRRAVRCDRGRGYPAGRPQRHPPRAAHPIAGDRPPPDCVSTTVRPPPVTQRHENRPDTHRAAPPRCGERPCHVLERPPCRGPPRACERWGAGRSSVRRRRPSGRRGRAAAARRACRRRG